MTVRVAYLVNQYPSASHTFIRREIEALERRGVQVERFSLRGWDAPLVDERDRRERARTRYVLQGGWLPLLRALVLTAVLRPRGMLSALATCLKMSRLSSRPWVHAAYLAEACLLLRWLERAGVDHLHAHFATNPAEVAMLTRLLGGPRYSFTGHGSDILDRPAEVGLQLTVSHAAFVVAVCWFGRSQIMKWVHHDQWPKIHVVGCGLEPGYGPAVSSSAPGERSRTRRFVCIGRLSKEKGQLVLLEACRLLKSKGLQFEVALVGDGPLRAVAQRFIQEHHLEDRVLLLGWQDGDRIRAELAQARALVVPSLSEGLPVVIMEAMACQCPVIAPCIAGIPELVSASSGWLFPAGNAWRLADAMQDCLASDEDRIATLGAAGWHAVWKDHDADTEAGKLLALFTQSVACEMTQCEAKPA